MAKGICRAVQFNHWADADVFTHLRSLYTSEDDQYFFYPWVEHHLALRTAFKGGYLSEMLFYPSQTINYFAALEGTVCVLCQTMGDSKTMGPIEDALQYQDALMLSEYDAPLYAYPDVYCSKCRSCVRNTTGDEFDFKLVKLLGSPAFLRRLEKSKKCQHRYKTKIVRTP